MMFVSNPFDVLVNAHGKNLAMVSFSAGMRE
jgi:hypothetical protein